MKGVETRSLWRWWGVSLEVPMASTRRGKAATEVFSWKTPAATPWEEDADAVSAALSLAISSKLIIILSLSLSLSLSLPVFVQI